MFSFFLFILFSLSLLLFLFVFRSLSRSPYRSPYTIESLTNNTTTVSSFDDINKFLSMIRSNIYSFKKQLKSIDEQVSGLETGIQKVFDIQK